MERWPLPVRSLLALAAAAAAVAATSLIAPLHSFPLLLPFPVAILACWYLGMVPGAACAIAEAVLVDLLLSHMQPATQMALPREEVRLAFFLVVAVFFGWAIRRMAQQRSQLALHELHEQLSVANAKRLLAEERARAVDALRDRDDLLQIALRVNGMGLWVWELESKEVRWSDEVYRIAGLEPGAMTPSIAGWIKLIHPDDAAKVRDAAERTQHAGAEYHQQYRLSLPDGSQRWIESKGRAQRDSHGRPLRIVGVIADVTGRKLSEEAMLRAEKLAVAGRLAASVAHEINNPLEAVANLLYLIASSPAAHSTGEMAQQALDELMRVSLITQQTLKFHRQAGTPKRTRLSEIMQTVLALFRGRMHTSQIEAELRTEDEVSVFCMPGEVQQIFANLVSNAIDAMPQGGRLCVRLRPSCDWRDGTTPGMRATILDSGTGMDDATRLRIFEPFFTTKADTGTGLGLWVVSQLVERHRGQVSIWSAQRIGASLTAVSVFLPMGDQPAAAAEA